MIESAGLLLFRRTPAGLEVFLAHPGGPFWRNRDQGAWTIPKGKAEEGEDLLTAARRELEEETGVRVIEPVLELGAVRQKAGKVVHAWAVERDADPRAITSNTATAEWPRRSGQMIEFPEVDKCAWFDLATARAKINPAQGEFLDRLAALLTTTAGSTG